MGEAEKALEERRSEKSERVWARRDRFHRRFEIRVEKKGLLDLILGAPAQEWDCGESR